VKPKVYLSWNPLEWEQGILREVLGDHAVVSWPSLEPDGYRDAEVALIVGAPSFLGSMERLRFIQVRSAGVEPGVLELAWARGVPVASSKGCNARAVAEMAFALLLALEKRVTLQDRKLKSGEWVPYAQETLVGDLEGKTMVILGFGGIGREVARIAEAFGIRVIPVASRERQEGRGRVLGVDRLVEVVREADYLVVTLPLTPRTRRLVGREVLFSMKSTAFLVNVGRGEVVDEEALYEALATGRIAGAGLDVWWRYPPDPSAPSPRGVHRLENVVATAHKGGWTRLSLERCLRFSAENVKRFLLGEEPLNMIRPGEWY